MTTTKNPNYSIPLLLMMATIVGSPAVSYNGSSKNAREIAILKEKLGSTYPSDVYELIETKVIPRLPDKGSPE